MGIGRRIRSKRTYRDFGDQHLRHPHLQLGDGAGVRALGIGEFLARADYHFSHSREMIRFMSAMPAASAMVCCALSYFLFARRLPHGS